MAYATKYRLEFGTKNASESNIGWRVDILQEAYTGSVIPIEGQSEPINFSYVGGQDPYQPFIPAKLDLNIDENIAGVQLDDFQANLDGNGVFNQRAYELRLSYQVNNVGNYIEYFRGFLFDVDGSRTHGAPPYKMKLSATDGMGIISSLPIPIDFVSAKDGKGRIGEYIFETLRKIGLGLDIAVYGDILLDNGDYAIVDTLVSNFAMFDEDYSNPKTYKQALDFVAKAFNSKVYQANGRWNVVSNAYLANVVSNTENIPYKLYEYADNAWSLNPTEVTDDNVLKTVNNATTAGDLKVLGGAIKESFRRPLFSTEWKCEEQNFTPIVFNPTFSFPATIDADNPLQDWSFVDTATYGSAVDATDFLTGNRSLTTDGYVDASEADSTVWFKQEIVATHWDTRKPFKISLDAKQIWTNSQVFKGRFAMRVYVQTTSGFDNFQVYNWDENKWDGKKNANRPSVLINTESHGDKPPYWIAVEQQISGEWINHNIELEAADFVRGAGSKIIIEIGGLRTISVTESKLSGYDLTTKIDNVFLSHTPASDDGRFEPFYELYQNEYRETYDTDQLFFSKGGDQFSRGKLSETSYNRRKDADESLSLERIVLQQQLNDYRGSYKRYSGTLIGSSTSPLHLNNKLNLDIVGGPDETVMLTSLSFMPRSNTYSFTGYVPNQATDVTATFVTEDVIPNDRGGAGRSNNVNYDLIIDITNVPLPAGALATETIDDYLTLDLPKSLDSDGVAEVGKYIKRNSYDNSLNNVLDLNVTMYPAKNYTLVDTNFSIRDTIQDDKPDSIVEDTFVDHGDPVTLQLVLELPDDSNVETAVIDGSVALKVDSVSFQVSVQTSGSNFDVFPKIIRETGQAGDVFRGEIVAKPVGNYVLLEGDVSAVSNDPDFVIGADAQSGLDVAIPYTLTLPSANDTGIVTVTGSPTFDPPGVVDPISFQVNLANSGNTGVSWLDTDGEAVSGLPQQVKTYAAKVDAAIGSFLNPGDLTSSNFVVSGTDASSVSFKEVIVTDEDAIAYFDIEYPTANGNATITLTNATASKDPYNLRFQLDTTTLNDVTYAPSSGFSDQTFNKTNADSSEGSITPVVFTFESSDPNKAFTAATNLAHGTLPTYSTNGTALTVTFADNTDDSNIPVGQIRATIAGGYPNASSDQVFTIPIGTAAANEPIEIPASSTNSSLTRVDGFGTLHIQGGYALFDVVSDGKWELYGWSGFTGNGRQDKPNRFNGSNGDYNGIRVDFTNDIVTHAGSGSTKVYLMKPNLFTDAQKELIIERGSATQAVRDAITTIFNTASNQLATPVTISYSSSGAKQPGFDSMAIEIVSALPASPLNKIYIVTT